LERQLLQAQKMQSVGTLAGGVAHEFNNLLAGINGYAALGLRQQGLSETLKEFLQHIVSLSERAAGLTRQLLTFARKPTLVRLPTPMADLVRTTADLVARTLLVPISLEIDDPAPAVPLIVEADANQLQQALINLALNARDALGDADLIKETAHPITFRLQRTMLQRERPAFPQNVPPGDYVVLEVIDRGCGMTPEVLGQALDPFFTTKDVGKGTGLGLPMVFGIVQGHQGHLAIDSAPHRGTSVSLFLPRLTDAPSSQESNRLFQMGQVLEPENTPGRSILVVDDEPAVQDVVRRFLELAGHRVACVSSGSEALEAVNNGSGIDLVILDLMMPREESAATFRHLQQAKPRLPILLCTGLPEASPELNLLRSGAAGVLRKPFRMNELWYAVNRVFDRPGEA
jgi:nitrogen-specific signal transduction histidine kinase/CheY-like chemotaxis protein